MTFRALGGLLVLNATFAVVGLAFLSQIGALRSRGELARLLGVAFFVGFALSGVFWTLLLVVRVPFGWPVVVAPAFLAIGSFLVRRRALSLRRLSASFVWPPLTAAVGAAATIVFFEALFRKARLKGLYTYDAWAFWIPKAKGIYFFGGLDEELFSLLPGSSYPPLIPALHAAAFMFMRSTDAVTLHVQYWLFAVGFAAAVVGLLWDRVGHWLLWPVLVLLVSVPRVSGRMLEPVGDFPLDFLFAVAALVVALWLFDDRRWPLAVIAVLLSGMVLTKREGVLLAAALLAAALTATALERGRRWRQLAVVALVVAAVAAPWRVWYVLHGLPGEAPLDTGLDLGARLDRAGAALRLAVSVFFDTGVWSLLPTVGVAAIALAFLARHFRLGVFFGVLLALVVLGGAWIVWAYPELPLAPEEAANPIVRYMVAAVALCGCATPLLLQAVWQRPRGWDAQE